MTNNDFIKDLMVHILEGIKIPKVQVERAINPILSLFIEGILTTFFKSNQNLYGKYELISPEFPLKKENDNQSTNIDFLLVNNSKKLLIFFELKTDVASIDITQLNRYIHIREKISQSSSIVLQSDLLEISKASVKKEKYNYIITQFDSVVKSPAEIKNLLIIYLVPKVLKPQISSYEKIDFVLSFSDLPKDIDHFYADEWKVIREELKFIDAFFEFTPKNLIHDPEQIIIENIKKYISASENQKRVISFQIGILGKSQKPNYQVNFSDGSTETFYFSGKPHQICPFKVVNLSKEIFWKDIEDQKSNS